MYYTSIANEHYPATCRHALRAATRLHDGRPPGLLRRFGTVHDVRLSPHNQSSLVLGYGEMSTQEQAQHAVNELHGTVVLGHKVIVHRSTLLGYDEILQ
jgi:hypothetical protein